MNLSEIEEDNCDDDSSTEKEDLSEFFGSDWIGKPGVSSCSSDSEDAWQEDVSSKQIREQFVLPPHIQLTNGDLKGSYFCSLCNSKFRLKSQIKYHVYCATGERPFKCRLCFKGFVKKYQYDRHLSVHTGEKPYVCPVCKKSFHLKDKLKRHELIHSGEKIECPICHKKLSRNDSLKAHMLLHDKGKKFSCTKCPKTYIDKPNLARHIALHEGIKNFICEHCGKAFLRKSSLVVHSKIHFGVRPFKCGFCLKAFKNKKELQRHRHVHKEHADLECSHCDIKFKRKDNLFRHLKNSHPEINCQKEKVEKEKVISSQEKNNQLSVIVNGNNFPESNVAENIPTQSVIKYTQNNARLQSPNSSREPVIKFTK